MLTFATRFGAVRSPKSIDKSKKVIDCWSKSRFEVQNCVTVENLQILVQKHCACRQLYVCEFGAPKKVSNTIGLLFDFTFYVLLWVCVCAKSVAGGAVVASSSGALRLFVTVGSRTNGAPPYVPIYQ